MKFYSEVYEHYQSFGLKEVFPKARQLWEVGHFNREAWDTLVSDGFWIDMLADKGDEAGWAKSFSALEGLSSSCCDSGLVLSMVSQFGVYWGLLQHGSPEQMKSILSKIRQGAICAIAIAEPHTGTNISRITTKAQIDGDRILLNGMKFNISHAQSAEILLVLGRLPETGPRDITTFIFPSSLKGIECEESPQKVGNRTLPTGNLKFTDVSLGRHNILAEAGEGIKAIATVSAIQRALYGLVGSVYLKPLLAEARSFIQSRGSAAKSPLVEEKLQRSEERMESLRQLSWKALDCVFKSDPKASKLASEAKLMTSLGMQEIASDLISLLGSRGHYHGIPNQLKADAQGWLWIGGTEEAHRLNLARN